MRPNSKPLPQFGSHVDLRPGTSIRPVAAMDQMLAEFSKLYILCQTHALEGDAL